MNKLVCYYLTARLERFEDTLNSPKRVPRKRLEVDMHQTRRRQDTYIDIYVDIITAQTDKLHKQTKYDSMAHTAIYIIFRTSKCDNLHFPVLISTN